jgi:hypothetical protein|uniref:Uncharacterized protein n=1 Tax=Lymantria dispar multicapsid nuclear polyhedrosis virus TaxID=10449 RepID=A0A2S1XC31_NPVLD|nr:hypothetical protein LdMNPV-T3_00132 [Lymantria dispar multiple nucleopolyhedrovirus]QCQ67383.1 hypothetical protein [Lymantria dispar multiple nucleopolyhedrovirus]QCQ67543.1 hypothetical protein [Lymantria dispar multiple nucleopolyhedrovirus]QCQ67701.1 hypothetical protein [Lymantria dispar multiple nucleopolyhedrovirus]QIT08179.1 hypothetical protein [Lymantria dispar multiple nucleopolyhedrovirus]
MSASSGLLHHIRQREMRERMNKLDAAMAVRRSTCVITYGASSSSIGLNRDNIKCPSLYEAEAIEFDRMLNFPLKRCLVCSRVVHPLHDVKSDTCQFCKKSATERRD